MANEPYQEPSEMVPQPGMTVTPELKHYHWTPQASYIKIARGNLPLNSGVRALGILCKKTLHCLFSGCLLKDNSCQSDSCAQHTRAVRDRSFTGLDCCEKPVMLIGTVQPVSCKHEIQLITENPSQSGTRFCCTMKLHNNVANGECITNPSVGKGHVP